MVGNPLVIAAKARARLQAALTSMREGRQPDFSDDHVVALPSPADLVITPCEVNEQHGTGTLLLRMFPRWESIISLRTSNFYDGVQAFGAGQLCLPLAQAEKPEIEAWLKWYLAGTVIRRIICFPYLPADVIVSLAVRAMFDAPLCTYIMDDKNVCAEGISDTLMAELMRQSQLRLVIGPEMRDAYEKKYAMKFWVVPPLVSDGIIRREPISSPELNRRCGVLLGNMWGQRWLDMLREMFRGSGYQVDWYCNQKDPAGLDLDLQGMERDGIRLCSAISERDLPATLSRYPFAVIPTDTLDGRSPSPVRAIAELSLPSRIPTVMATAHTPMLVIGHPQTCAARFVTRFGLGEVVPYERAAITTAIDRLLVSRTQTAIRQRAAVLGSKFSAKRAAEWIWRSLELGGAADRRWEELFPPLPDEDIIESFSPVLSESPSDKLAND